VVGEVVEARDSPDPYNGEENAELRAEELGDPLKLARLHIDFLALAGLGEKEEGAR
jgi:hypothetical protein